jgi:hypothetical protein
MEAFGWQAQESCGISEPVRRGKKHDKPGYEVKEIKQFPLRAGNNRKDWIGAFFYLACFCITLRSCL